MKNKNANKPTDTSEQTGVREMSCSTFYDSKGRWMNESHKEKKKKFLDIVFRDEKKCKRNGIKGNYRETISRNIRHRGELIVWPNKVKKDVCQQNSSER